MSVARDLLDRMRDALLELVRSPRTLVVGVLIAVSIAAGWTASRSAVDRGLTRESLWLLESVEQRTDYYRAVRKLDMETVRNDDAIAAAFTGHSALPPLMPAVVSTIKSTSAKRTPAQIATRVNAVVFALFVLLVGLMGLEVGGAFGALAAAVGAMTVPRLFGVGNSVGFGMMALFVLTLTPWLLHRARWSRLATVGAVLGIAASIHVGYLGLYVWFPWIYLILTRPREHAPDDGLTATPPVPLRNLLIVPLGVALGFLAYPWLWVETKDHLLGWLSHFMRQPATPFSYMGEVWGHERIPWHAAPYLVAVTVPPAFLLLALGGLRGGPLYRKLSSYKALAFLDYLPFRPESREPRRDTLLARRHTREDALRLARVMLVVTLALPLIYRSPYFAGIDLVALSLPWVLVFAAAGMQRLVHVSMDAVPWRQAVRSHGRPSARLAVLHMALVTVISALLLVPPALDVVRYHPLEEAYYSWLIGGPEGARNRGLPRYPAGPMPTTLLREIAAEAGTEDLSVGFMLRSRGDEHVLGRTVGEGYLPPTIRPAVSVYDADIAILTHDDLDPAYEAAATDFFRTVNGEADPPFGVIVYERGAVPIFSAAIAPR